MKYKAIKILRISVPRPLFNDYLFWFDERLKMTQTIADTHAFCRVIHINKCKRHQTI